ncbi:hypothetical protein ACFQ1S_01305 [Kibdelosporangium lantanae]|uniref:Uncharacterized protein n=1 Tax=Kibdelosporangium lantanae TaxID=1497396 RepID=A0ABW3M0W2_9PSEU
MNFFEDVLLTGTVSGVDAGAGPEVVARVLGPDHAREVTAHRLSYHYDLVEFFWYKRPRGLGYQDGTFTVQAHRLDNPPSLPDLDLVPDGDPTYGYQRYFLPSSEMTVVTDAETGTIHSISPGTPRPTTAPKPLLQSMKHVLTLTPADRTKWLSAKGFSNTEWESRCRVITAHTLTRTPLANRDAWATFATWAWRQLAPTQAAAEIAKLLAGLENHFVGEYPSMPAAAEIVQNCLTHVTDRMSLVDKKLIDAAMLHRHALADTVELDRWWAARTDIPTATLPQLSQV